MKSLFYYCRGDRIRTCDPLVPNQVRYQLRYAPYESSFPLNSIANLGSFFESTKLFAKKMFFYSNFMALDGDMRATM